MKRCFFAVATLCFVLFVGCDSDGGSIFSFVTDPTETGYDITTATQSVTWNYTSLSPIFEVDPTVLSVQVNNIPSGKTLYLVKHNAGSVQLPLSDTRTIVSSSRSALLANTVQAVDDAAIEVPLQKKHFVGEKLPKLHRTSHGSRSALTAPSYAVTPITATEGSTTKQIYIDVNSAMSKYEKRDATLRAVGTNCYVWVVNDYYNDTASGNKVNTTIAKKYATAFDKMYPVITNVFGNESNEIIDYDAQASVAIAEKSNTGEKINIVVYDIGADYSSTSSGGVVGYFYAKDYYYSAQARSDIIGKSNVGKYFYIDSGFANSNFNDTISTLAHEFQHMVDFNQKEMLHDASPEAWYNEMLSMLCEDMMQGFLGLKDYASPKNRIQSFNAYYSQSGITEYRNDDYAALSYSTAYAFGSWLARQYGGAELVKKISQNASVDTASIVAAVNAVNNTSSHTFNSLFKQFLLALTKSTTYTHNKDAAQTVTYSDSEYTYPMKAFDLWWTGPTDYDSDGDKKDDATYAFKLKGTDFESLLKTYKYSGYDWYGPFLYAYNYGPSYLRAGNGISMHGIKTTTAGSETFTFSSQGADTLKMYLIIQ